MEGVGDSPRKGVWKKEDDRLRAEPFELEELLELRRGMDVGHTR